MFKKNILIFLISSKFCFAGEELPEVKLESLSFATIVKKENIQEKKIDKKIINYYPSKKSIKCTSGFGWKF